MIIYQITMQINIDYTIIPTTLDGIHISLFLLVFILVVMLTISIVRMRRSNSFRQAIVMAGNNIDLSSKSLLEEKYFKGDVSEDVTEKVKNKIGKFIG